MYSKYKILLKDTIIFALGNLGSKILLFLMVPLYTNVMSSDEFGTADLIFTIAQLLIPFFSVVIFDAVIRYGLSKNEEPVDVLLIGCVVFLFSTVLTIMCTPLLGIYQPIKEWKWFLCCYIIFNMANSIQMNYLKVKNRNKTFAILSVTQTSIMVSLSVWMLMGLHLGIKGYLLAYILSNLFIDMILLKCGGIIADLKTAKFSRSLLKEMVFYSTPLILNNVSWWVIHSSDKVMVQAMIGSMALGIYSVAAKIPSLINVFVTIFQQAWGISSIKEIEESNDTGFYTSVFKTYYLLSVAACIVFISLVKVFMQFYVGASFQDAWRYVPFLLVSAVYAAIASFYGSLYGALKKSKNNMLTTLSAAVINIIMNFIFIPRVGVWGAVIGTIISYIAIATIRMIDVNKYIPIKIDKARFIINNFIVILQAFFVSMSFHIYTVSFFSMVIFVILNYRDIRKIFFRRKKK